MRQERIIVLEKSNIGNDEYTLLIGLPDGDSGILKVSKEAYERTRVGK